MDEHEQTPPKKTPPDEATGILRRLQGEDGYDVFADRKATNERERLRREYEDSRW